jgi:tRNA-uridine 2-sulfurtransferase
MSTKPVVVIAMSGGVDSSVAAALLVEQGYSVIGMMLKLWSEQDSERDNRCCTPDSIALARRVASILSIPFYVIDAKQIFYDKVVKAFIDGYTQNRTPNPCIFCNKFIRWDFLYNHALAIGADYLATGHYAQIIHASDDTLQLSLGRDSAKDQSYVLHVLTQPQLKHALFPLGGYTKHAVRQLASKFNLPVADRPDSQDLCFIGSNGDYRLFLSQHAPDTLNPGPIMDQRGQILGNHPGLAFFTIGQRKGLHISSPVPLYVIRKDVKRNILIVGTREETGSLKLIADSAHWIGGVAPHSPFRASVKIRYTAPFVRGTVNILDDQSFSVEFENLIPDITPGQAAVIYNGDICLGGGMITNQES